MRSSMKILIAVIVRYSFSGFHTVICWLKALKVESVGRP